MSVLRSSQTHFENYSEKCQSAYRTAASGSFWSSDRFSDSPHWSTLPKAGPCVAHLNPSNVGSMILGESEGFDRPGLQLHTYWMKSGASCPL